MKIFKLFVSAVLFLTAASSFAQTNGSPSNGANGTITAGTQSNAQQAVNVNNAVAFPSGGPSDVTYHGSYSVKSAPTVYAPSLTASITETCWGSISGAVSVMGFGATGAATIKDYDCNRRLTAAVAGKMGRMDIAFNLMCQDDQFRSAAAITDKPCPSGAVEGKQGTEIEPAQKNAQKSNNLKADIASTPKTVVDPKTGQAQYSVADTSNK